MREFAPGGLMDGHAHLDLLDEPEKAVKEAVGRGVRGVVGVSMGMASMRHVLSMAVALPEIVHPALGLHPWQIDQEEVEPALAFLAAHLSRAAAVGEIGLDYRIRTKKEIQREVLRRQLELAKEADLPVVLHCRYSHSRVLEMVKEAGIRRAVFHWYSGPSELLADIVSNGYFVSATPAVAYSPNHREAILRAPLDRILLETDSPVSYEGRAARPVDVVQVCAEVARLRGCTVEETARETLRNTRRWLGGEGEGGGGTAARLP